MIRSVSTPSSQIRLEFEAFRVTSHELLRRRLRREDSLLDWKLVLVEKSGEKSVLARGRGEDAMIEHDDSNRRRYVVATLLPDDDDDEKSSKKMEIWIRSRNKKDRVRLGHAAVWFDHEMKALRLSGSSERLEITKWNTSRESVIWKCHPRCVWIPSSCHSFVLNWSFHCTNLDMMNEEDEEPWLKWKLTTKSKNVVAAGMCGTNEDRDNDVEGLHRVVVKLSTLENTTSSCSPGDMLHLWFRPCDRVMSKASLCGETHVGVVTSSFYLSKNEDHFECPIWSSDAAVDFTEIDPFTSGWRKSSDDNGGYVTVGNY